YRFLDATGAVIKPPNPYDVGELDVKTEAQLALSRLADTQQIGYIRGNTETGGGTIDEVIAVPIFSSDTGDVISALVIGFKPLELEEKHSGVGMRRGVWVKGKWHLPSLPISAQEALNEQIASTVAISDREQNNFRVNLDGAPQLFFYKRLNPGSLFPAAYEICVYPLAYSMAELH